LANIGNMFFHRGIFKSSSNKNDSGLAFNKLLMNKKPSDVMFTNNHGQLKVEDKTRKETKLAGGVIEMEPVNMGINTPTEKLNNNYYYD
jgi:hypothetical protein